MVHRPGQDPRETRTISARYHAKADGSSIRKVHSGICGVNGVGLSPNDTTAYVAETSSARLIAVDTDPSCGASPTITSATSLGGTTA